MKDREDAPPEIDPKSLQRNSSLQTIFTLTNCMVGGTMLLLPTLTIEAGLATSTIVLAISCFVSYVTCAIYVKHMREEELDIQWTIKRILGKGWYIFFVVTCSIYKYFLCQLYYILIIDMIYSEICFFLHLSKVDPKNYQDPRDENPPFNLKVFSSYWIMFDIGNLGGTAALAFTIHTSFGNMIKCNKNQRNNVRDLGLSYISGYSVYLFISLFGAMGVLNRDGGVLHSKITDFFGPDNWAPVIVQLLYLTNLMSVLPVFWDVSKRRFFAMVNKGREQVSDRVNLIANIVFMVTSMIFKCIPGIHLSDITSFNGSLCCFFFVYLIPIVMHFTCYKGQNKFLRKIQRKISHLTATKPLPYDDFTDFGIVDNRKMVQSFQIQNSGKKIDFSTEGYNTYSQSFSEESLQQKEDEQLTTPMLKQEIRKIQFDINAPLEKQAINNREERSDSCGQYCKQEEQISSKGLILRYIFYGFIGLVGLIILIQGLYNIIKGISSGGH